MFGIGKSKSHQIRRLEHDKLMELAQKVVKRYVNRGSVPRREEEDMTMTVIEKFLQKEETIYASFQGQSQISTYCIAILNRMTCEVIRKEMKHWSLTEGEEDLTSTKESLSQTDYLMIKDEVLNLTRLLLFFGDERHKIKLFFAFYYRLSITHTDLEAYDFDYLAHSLDKLFTTNESMSKGEIFTILSEVVRRVESRQAQPDAIRMWLNKVRNSLITRLNLGCGSSGYDKESFQALFEFYYNDSIEKETQHIDYQDFSSLNQSLEIV